MPTNNNKNTWLIYRGYVKADKKAFIDELKCKGYKLTGKEGIDKITEMVLGLHKHLLKNNNHAK